MKLRVIQLCKVWAVRGVPKREEPIIFVSKIEFHLRHNDIPVFFCTVQNHTAALFE